MEIDKDELSLEAAREIMKLTRQGEFDDQLKAKIQVEINKALDVYNTRIENAIQVLSGADMPWENQGRAAVTIGVDYGSTNEPSSGGDQLSPAVEYINTHEGPLFSAMVTMKNLAREKDDNKSLTYWQHEINALVSVIKEMKVKQNG